MAAVGAMLMLRQALLLMKESSYFLQQCWIILYADGTLNKKRHIFAWLWAG